MFDLADIWAARTGREVRLVSANDHVHSRGSAHYAGLALDFHSSDPDGLSELFREAGYRVLWEVPGHYAHVHVESNDAVDRPVATRGVRSASRRRAQVTASEADYRESRGPARGGDPR